MTNSSPFHLFLMTSATVWITLLSTWTFILLISFLLLTFYRHHPSLIPRFPLLTLAGIFCHWIIFTIFSLSIILPNVIPCSINLWTAYIFINLWLMSLEGRFTRFAVLYKSAEWNLGWALGEDKRRTNAQELEARVWFHRYRTLLTERAISWVIVVMTLCLSIVVAIIHINTPTLMHADERTPNCTTAGWVFYPFYVFVAVNLLCLGGLAWIVRNCSDVYGIRRELYCTLSLGILSFILVMALDSDDIYAFFGDWYASIIWLFIGMMLAHILAVLFPIYLIMRGHGTCSDLEGAEFSMILDTPDLFEEFKAFSVKDLTIENVLFHEHYIHFKHTFEHDHSRASIRLLRDMYHTFIKQGAPLELNLTSSTLQTVRLNYATSHLDAQLFDKVHSEVLELMRYNTFPRFIESQRKEPPPPPIESLPPQPKVEVGVVSSAYYSKERRQEIEQMNRNTFL